MALAEQLERGNLKIFLWLWAASYTNSVQLVSPHLLGLQAIR